MRRVRRSGPAAEYLKDVQACGVGGDTASYGMDPPRWFRFCWAAGLDVAIR